MIIRLIWYCKEDNKFYRFTMDDEYEIPPDCYSAGFMERVWDILWEDLPELPIHKSVPLQSRPDF